ncbi:MAG: hypothetical protein AB7L92_05010 [Alphaproteobacteria bacterium]
MPSKIRLYSESKPRNFLEALQEAVLNRVTKPYRGQEPVVYEFTQDRALLHQYYRLREVMYQRMYHAKDLKAEEDLHDKLSHILIARRGNLCLGGCRLTIREGDEMWDLPMETTDFKLRRIFSNLPLLRERHGEISRFAIMEDCGDEDIFRGLCKVMYDKVVDSEIHYLFAKSTLALARNWRLIANSFGVKGTRICNEVTVPENPVHPGLKWYVTASNLSSLYDDLAESVFADNAYITAGGIKQPDAAVQFIHQPQAGLHLVEMEEN